MCFFLILHKQIMSNRLYFAGVTESIKLMQPHTKVYVYVDYFKIKYGIGEKLSKGADTTHLGVSHGEDVDLDNRDKISYLKLNYPQSVVIRDSGLNDEEFWNSLDFNDAPYERICN
uniref:Uncharacterized protein n=1 Tax=Anopheles melas TaxID=34690 RepID=A0A182U037_9DIPT